jgi:pilus assembly protein CpaE
VYLLAIGTVVQTKQIWEELGSAIQDLGVRTVFELPELPEDWPAFLERIDRVRPDVILLEVTNLREPLEEIVARIRSRAAQPAVFALHLEPDPAAILTALRAGVAEYLYPPFSGSLKVALERVGRSREKSSESLKPGGKTVGFVSVKGGCGATTIACHVAAELPRQTHSKVLLADLDLQAGMIRFLMKVKSPYTIANAAHNLQRLDPSYWRALVFSNGIPDLEVITAPLTTAEKELSAAHVKQVVAFARSQYPWTVLDLGRNLNPLTLGILELIDETYLVTTHEVPALHQAKQMIQTLLDGGYAQSKLKLLLNRLPKHSDVTLTELEEMLGLPFYATIANQYQPLQEAYSGGHMMDPHSPLGGSFNQLAKKIAGVTEKTKKRFGLFS